MLRQAQHHRLQTRLGALASLVLVAPLLSGCLVRTAADVATAPVRAVGWTADKLTTSQSEADRNRGRRERKAEEKQARAERKAQREAERQAQEGS